MKGIGSFLEKFTTLKPPERFVKEVCINAVQKETGIVLTVNEIDIRGETLLLTTSPAKKTDITLHKPAILSELQNSLKQYRKTISDIR